MGIDLRKLEIFCRVAELGSVSRAGEELHLAQPAVSIALKKLEASLETQLFQRTGRSLTLTTAGRDLLPRALAILTQVDDLQRSNSELNELLRGEVRIACPSMLATYFLPDLLSGFLGDHPGLKADVTQAGTATIEAMLLQDDIEIGVTSHRPNSDGELELIPLITETMVVCMPGTHHWAQRRYLKVEELDSSPMVLYESGYHIRSELDRLCADHKVTPDLRMQSNFLPLLLKMVRQNLGTTIGLSMMAAQETGIVGVPLLPTTEIPMALAKRRGSNISRANQAFLDWVSNRLSSESATSTRDSG